MCFHFDHAMMAGSSSNDVVDNDVDIDELVCMINNDVVDKNKLLKHLASRRGCLIEKRFTPILPSLLDNVISGSITLLHDEFQHSLLSTSPSVNVMTLPLTYHSCMGASTDIITRLLTLSPDVSVHVVGIETPFVYTSLYNAALFKSCGYGRLHLVEYFLTNVHGVDVSDNNFYAIRWAARYGRIDVVNRLLEIPCVYQAKEALSHAFLLAAKRGHVSCVERFLDHPNIDIDRCAITGQSALLIAAEAGQLDVVSLLFNAAGSNISIAKRDEAIERASRRRQRSVIAWLKAYNI